MRYEVEKQIEEIDKALAIIEMRKIPNMKKPTEEELEFALKKAASCMSLMLRELSKKDITMKELNEELRGENNTHTMAEKRKGMIYSSQK